MYSWMDDYQIQKIGPMGLPQNLYFFLCTSVTLSIFFGTGGLASDFRLYFVRYVDILKPSLSRDEKGQPQATDPAKKLRNLKKKLRDIEALEAKVFYFQLAHSLRKKINQYRYGTSYISPIISFLPLFDQLSSQLSTIQRYSVKM